jgi:hypothetical protein
MIPSRWVMAIPLPFPLYFLSRNRAASLTLHMYALQHYHICVVHTN